MGKFAIMMAAGCVGLALVAVVLCARPPVNVTPWAFELWSAVLLLVCAVQPLVGLINPELTRSGEGKGLNALFWVYVLVPMLSLLALILAGMFAFGHVWPACAEVVLGVMLLAGTACFSHRKALWGNGYMDEIAPYHSLNNESQFGHMLDLPLAVPRRRDVVKTWAMRALMLCNAAVLTITICCVGILVHGAYLQAYGTQAYTPERAGGRMVTLDLAGGHQAFYLDCKGPSNSSRQTVFLDADLAHGAADFWPLQAELVSQGYRACAFDKPGLGWSDPWRTSQAIYCYIILQKLDVQTFYAKLLEASGEPTPYVLVGWGGGADNVYRYALQWPKPPSQRVHALVLVEAWGENVDYRALQSRNNWTDQKAQSFARADLGRRRWLFALIRLLGVPWGLMGSFLDGASDYDNTTLYDEYHWFYTTQKTWTTQYFALLQMRSQASPVINPACIGLMTCFGMWLKRSLELQVAANWRGLWNQSSPELKGKRLVNVQCNRSFADICGHVPVEAQECQDQLADARFLLEDAQIISQVTQNGTIIQNNHSDCDLGLPLKHPEFVVNAINTLFY
eukprot:gene12562-349_t